MAPTIEIIGEKKLVGIRLAMSFVDYKVGKLWETFMPRRKEIVNIVSEDLISMVMYKPDHFSDFKPTNEFERWAAVEVTDFDHVPTDMETFVLSSGRYAVFLHKGDKKDFSKSYQFILGTWLPHSGYTLDDRPHFEVLGKKYRNNDPNSEEEIWIPIKAK